MLQTWMLSWCLPANHLWDTTRFPVVFAETTKIVGFCFVEAVYSGGKIAVCSDRMSLLQIYSKLKTNLKF